MKVYPVVFQPVFKEMIWGGAGLRRFGKAIPSEQTGESWDVTCRPNEMSVVRNGPLAGQTLGDLIRQDPVAWLGGGAAFPLLVKTIHANQHLSVQVHPGDAYAARHEAEPLGKAEMWYILEPPAEGFLIAGLRPGVDRERLRQALEAGGAEDLLGRLPVAAGDIIDIPPGLLHAITRGTILVEIQQNSDLTYRVYDYNRLGPDGNPRALHIAKALDVIDFNARPQVARGLARRAAPGCAVTRYVQNESFVVEKYQVETLCEEQPPPGAFCLFTCVTGQGELTAANETVALRPGETVLVPAGVEGYRVTGRCGVLKSFAGEGPANYRGSQQNTRL
jgi:mannose-6-phosphate isomerase